MSAGQQTPNPKYQTPQLGVGVFVAVRAPMLPQSFEVRHQIRRLLRRQPLQQSLRHQRNLLRFEPFHIPMPKSSFALRISENQLAFGLADDKATEAFTLAR